MKLTGKIAKRDDEKFLVFGYASMADVTDSQGDVISIDTLEKAAYDFVLHSRMGGEITQKNLHLGGFFSPSNLKNFLSRIPQFISEWEDFFCLCRLR